MQVETAAVDPCGDSLGQIAGSSVRTVRRAREARHRRTPHARSPTSQWPGGPCPPARRCAATGGAALPDRRFRDCVRRRPTYTASIPAARNPPPLRRARATVAPSRWKPKSSSALLLAVSRCGIRRSRRDRDFWARFHRRRRRRHWLRRRCRGIRWIGWMSIRVLRRVSGSLARYVESLSGVDQVRVLDLVVVGSVDPRPLGAVAVLLGRDLPQGVARFDGDDGLVRSVPVRRGHEQRPAGQDGPGVVEPRPVDHLAVPVQLGDLSPALPRTKVMLRDGPQGVSAGDHDFGRRLRSVLDRQLAASARRRLGHRPRRDPGPVPGSMSPRRRVRSRESR